MPERNLQTRIEGQDLIMECRFDAPKELMYAAHTSPEHLAHWWGPTGWDTHSEVMDVRVGGVWHYCMRSSIDGQESWGKAVYQEVVPGERLVYKDVFADQYGNEIPDMPKMLIHLEFSEQGDQSILISHTSFESEEALQKIIDMQGLEGMAETYDRLHEYLNSQKNSKEEDEE